MLGSRSPPRHEILVGFGVDSPGTSMYSASIWRFYYLRRRTDVSLFFGTYG